MFGAADKKIVLLMLAILLWPRFVFIPVGGIGLSPFSLAMLLMELLACLGLLRAIQSGGGKSYPLIVLFVLYVFWVFVADFAGEVPAASLSISLRNIVYLYGGFFIGLYVLSTPRTLVAIPVIFSLVVVVTGMIGILERLTERSFVDMIGLGAIMANAGAAELLLAGTFRAGGFRASSLFSHPIIFSQFLGASLGFSLSLVTSNRTLVKLMGLAAVCITPVAIFASNTRSGYVALIVSGAIYTLLSVRRRFGSGGGIVLIGAIATGLMLAILGLFREEISALVIGRTAVEMASTEARDSMISAGFSAIAKSPVSGFGDGMSALKAGLVGAGGILTIDNLYLSVMLDFGFVGLALFLMVAGVGLMRGVALAQAARTPDTARAIIGMVSFAGGIIIGQYVVTIIDNMLFVFMFFGIFAAGLALAPAHPVRRMPRLRNSRLDRRLPVRL